MDPSYTNKIEDIRAQILNLDERLVIEQLSTIEMKFPFLNFQEMSELDARKLAKIDRHSGFISCIGFCVKECSSLLDIIDMNARLFHLNGDGKRKNDCLTRICRILITLGRKLPKISLQVNNVIRKGEVIRFFAAYNIW